MKAHMKTRQDLLLSYGSSGGRQLAALLAAAVSRRRAGGALAAALASFGVVNASAAKKRKKKKDKKKKNKQRSTGGCTSPGAPDTLVCTSDTGGCGGSHQCCACNSDTSGRFVCMNVTATAFVPCQENEDCALGEVCDAYSRFCVGVCVL